MVTTRKQLKSTKQGRWVTEFIKQNGNSPGVISAEVSSVLYLKDGLFEYFRVKRGGLVRVHSPVQPEPQQVINRDLPKSFSTKEESPSRHLRVLETPHPKSTQQESPC